MILETRLCEKCAKKFKVLETSQQKYCCKICETGNYQENYFQWKGLKNQSKDVRKEQESELEKNTGKTPLSPEPKKEPDTQATSLKSEPDPKIDTSEIKTPITLEKNSGTKVIEIKRTQVRGSIMKKTNQESGSLSEKEGLKEIQRMDSPKSLETSETVDSPSTSLINDSSKYLLNLMKGIFQNQPEPEIRSYDPDKVKAACLCADQIYKLQKLKLDSIKLQKDLHSYFKKNNG
ncbi:MAG: hypothetical protein BWY19_00773 [bacterium ADurb.Bin212]|nr:MAG: hypothetical protein BWY19_00773 [bacterium ADurb.Bin212]